ncbi:hypothetical protein ACQZ4R_07595 [Agrobacterium vitis]
MYTQAFKKDQAERLRPEIKKEERFLENLSFYNQKIMHGPIDKTEERRVQSLTRIKVLKQVLALYQ